MQIGFIEDTKLHGGTQLWVFEAIVFFLQLGHKITIITPNKGWISEECQKRKVPVTLVIYDYDHICAQNTEYEKIWGDALRDCDIAVCTVHPPRDGFHCSIFAARCIKKAKLKTILITKTGTIVPTYNREFYLPDESIRSFIITISHFSYEYLLKKHNIPEYKITRIYQGIDIDKFTPNNNRKKDIMNTYPLFNFSPILGCIGSLEQRKGHIILFKALKILKNNFLPKIHLLIVGDGPDEYFLKESVTKMGLEDQITFIPFTRKPENIYERIDILVFPSLYKEGLPNVILESLAMETPVIASNIGGISEIVQNGGNGYLLEPNNVQQLTEAINLMWSDQKNYQRFYQNTRQNILKNFNRKVQFRKYLDYFQKIQP